MQVATARRRDIISAMRLVLDTDVVVAALRSPNGASRRLMELLRAGRIRAVATVGMMMEYEAVLMREEQLAATRLTTSELASFLDGLAALMVPVETHFLWRPQLSDPNDEMVLEAAVNGRAERIVTFNVADFLPAAHRFGLAVERPGDTLRRLR
ncbi:MAG: putative toxin-antitoxin system toxin component, PIN family [Halochromatium sp.]